MNRIPSKYGRGDWIRACNALHASGGTRRKLFEKIFCGEPYGKAGSHPVASKQHKKRTRLMNRIPSKYGRGDWIRTSGLYVPNVALYQAEPHLEKCGPGIGAMAAEEGFEPSQTESESVVLPLHNSAISLLQQLQQQDLLYQTVRICQSLLLFFRRKACFSVPGRRF